MPSPIGRAATVLAMLALIAAARGQDAAPPGELLQRLQSHNFFRRVTFKADESIKPYRFLLQAPLKADEKQYDRSVINPVLPFLNRLRAEFEATYGTPNKLVARPEALPYTIAVLASRGSYDDYARATQSSSLHQSLAHYNFELRLAVTYRDPFGASDTAQERTSILHEFVHAMQHAYSATGTMPKPMWFNEGLAEYRSCSGSMAASLADPPLNEYHADLVTQLLQHPIGRRLVLPIEQLVRVTTYGEVVDLAAKNGAAELNVHPVSAFYAHSELLVRFLHVGEGGKHRPAFIRYFAAVEGGADGFPAFQECFGISDAATMAGMETAFREWLADAHAKAMGKPGAAKARQAVPATAPLAAPTAFDAKELAWQDADFSARLDLARSHCRSGDFAAALAALPATAAGADQARLDAERKRIQELTATREKLLQKLKQATGDVDLGGRRGRFVRVDGVNVVLAGKAGEQSVPFDAKAMLAVGLNPKDKDNVFQFGDVWKAAWLHWLGGNDAAAQAAIKGKTFSWVPTIGAEIATPLGADAGAVAAELAYFQATPLPDDRAAAQAMFARLRATASSGNLVWQRRKDAVGKLAQALAERAFAADDPVALGLHGKVSRLADGRMQVVYDDPSSAPDADFAPSKDFGKDGAPRQIAYDGPTCVRMRDGQYEVLGDGPLAWRLPLTGPHEVEFEFQVPDGDVDRFLALMAQGPDRGLFVLANGVLGIRDDATGMRESNGGNRLVKTNAFHHLRFTHDGAKEAAVFIDGKRTGYLAGVGKCTSGNFVLAVRSSTPILLRNLKITSKLVAPDPAAARAQLAADWQQQVWRPAPATAPASAPAPTEPAPPAPKSPKSPKGEPGKPGGR